LSVRPWLLEGDIQERTENRRGRIKIQEAGANYRRRKKDREGRKATER